jgi:hypothetical protein
VKQTLDHAERWKRRPVRPGAPAARGGDCTPDKPQFAREALKAFIRALARAAAIEDYHRRNRLGEEEHEGGDLRQIQLRPTD